MKIVAFCMLVLLLDADLAAPDLVTPPPGFRWWELLLYGAIVYVIKPIVERIIEERKKTPKQKLTEAVELLKEMDELKQLLKNPDEK